MLPRLYNTRTRKKEEFRPLDPSNVRMYVCGPTVYDYAHIGNARPVIVFDLLYRLLRHLYEPEHVRYVRNITDVDDKINARACELYPDLPLNEAIRKLTVETTAQFHRDVAALGCLPPTDEPRATEYIEQMRAMIETLVEKGFAYVGEEHVLFHVAAMPDYGQLARRSLDEMRAGARIEVAPYKRDPMDFVLWKPSKEGEPSWPSPSGIASPGRPGWHLECSAMAGALLGDVFDIHGGGIDLVFPHHENEVAQSRCAHGTELMANVWMHNGHLQVEGEKMSKSEGNFVTINELLKDWGGYGWPGDAIRFNMLHTHYRQPTDWTYDSLDNAHKTLWDWYGHLADVEPSRKLPDAFIEPLLDDLNTPGAIAELHKMAQERRYADLLASLQFLGLTGRRDRLGRLQNGEAQARTLASDAEIRALIEARIAARTEKNWAEADRIRDELVAMGVVIKDAKNPKTGEIETSWEIAR
ncbi:MULTISPECIES: cysteine--tRNA ligase [Rhodomicrobium]|uniref:cysteine--tRNA ligase n=1 Tax=Rhodomicrobium TaxID=1068 RepID=UPI000B4C1161|nr:MULTISPECIES: cysteine--tRNA ligase [Rhodomicrobium]